MELREAAVTWARQRRKAGVSWRVVASEIGVPAKTLHQWVTAKRPQKPRKSLRRRAVPVEVVVDAIGARVVSPNGYRVEGLTLSEVATLLRELS